LIKIDFVNGLKDQSRSTDSPLSTLYWSFQDPVHLYMNRLVILANAMPTTINPAQLAGSNQSTYVMDYLVNGQNEEATSSRGFVP
jgi:hypothetical protein